MSEILYYENFHTKHGVFTTPYAHIQTSLSYTLWAYKLQPANKAVKYQINSYD